MKKISKVIMLFCTVLLLPGTLTAKSTQSHAKPNAERLLTEMQRVKGEVIGTKGKGVVALRFDDYQSVFGTSIFPLLIDRGLPCSMALISRFDTAQPWGANASWDDVRTWNQNGVEIWSHGTDHKDYIRQSFLGLYREIVVSKAEIEAQNMKVQGWALPGVTPISDATPYNSLTKPEDFNSIPGRLVMQTYALSEAYAYPPQRVLPSNIYHGLNHFTVSDKATLEMAKNAVQYAVETKTGIELMCHAGNLDKPGNMTLAQFVELLDYIKDQWDRGAIEVLTPSGLCFADPESSYRLQFSENGSFEELTEAKPTQWSAFGQLSKQTIESTGGRTGSRFLRIKSADSGLTQKISLLNRPGTAGEQLLFEGWYRNDGNAIAAVQIQDAEGQNFSVTRQFSGSGSTWKRARFAFGIPPTVKELTITVLQEQDGLVDWDDVSVSIV